jgi:hypothetical protein
VDAEALAGGAGGAGGQGPLTMHLDQLPPEQLEAKLAEISQSTAKMQAQREAEER